MNDAPRPAPLDLRERLPHYWQLIRGDRPIGRVKPAEAFQLVVPKRLDTETQPVDAGLAKPVHSLDARGLGIGLEGDLGARFDPERLPAGAD